MIMLTRETRILLGVQPADFRKGIDGFQGVCRAALDHDPTDGTLYVFINRAGTMIRALAYHESGFWLMTKRLSRGRFTGWPVSGEPVSSTSAQALRELLAGGAWTEAQIESSSMPRTPSLLNQSLTGPCSRAPTCVTV